ncbi:MAG: NAD-dependent epimerase/dehydratase family protein [Patescibacteria group bacterium]
MKTLVVIGGNGMLGSDLVRHLSATFRVTAIDRKNYSTYIGSSFDVLINANGNSKRFWANTNIFDDFTASTVSVYKSIFDFKFSTYVYISSSDVYANHSGSQFTSENQAQDSSKLSAYGFHKYLSERIVENNCRNYIILRSSLILGSNLKKGPLYDILNRKPFYISDSSRLQLITTKEISRIISFLLNKKITKEIFNMGGKGIVDFKKIQKYFSVPVTFSKDTEIQIYETNVSKLNNIFPLKTSELYLQEFLKTLQ